MNDLLLIRELYNFSNVEQINIQVLDSWDNAMNGKSMQFTPNSKALFYIDCPFSECYGPLKGFRFDNQIYEMVRQRLSSLIFHIECGGFGDHGQHHHCDNWIEIQICIKYNE